MAFRGHGIVIVPGDILVNDALVDRAAEVMALCGDLSMSSAFRARRNITVRVLNQTNAGTDEIGIMVPARIAAANHDCGTPTGPGRVVGLYGTA